MQTEALLHSLFDAAVRAANPEHCLPAHLGKFLREFHPTDAEPAAGRTVVIGAGKAAAAMARAVEDCWPADQPLSGLVITRYGHGLPAERMTRRIDVMEAAHPVPDSAGEEATQRLLGCLEGLTANDRVLVLISGGGSALLAAPLPGVSLQDKRTITQSLLRSGARISEINVVRKHLSAIKGGRLALACAPAQVLTLAISDVPGDDLCAIASGPTVPDPSTCEDALAICTRYGIHLPQGAHDALTSGAGETPKAGTAGFARCKASVVATAQASLQAAAALARAAGITPLVLGDRIEGEAREVAKVLAAMAMSCAEHGVPATPPCVLLSGGETTVTVRNAMGRGGRNAEFLLALALALDAHPRIHALAADTDGIDGTEDNAGALIAPDTLARLRNAGIDPAQRLEDNDAYPAFAAIDALLVTGPTRTNVNDFRAILIT